MTTPEKTIAINETQRIQALNQEIILLIDYNLLKEKTADCFATEIVAICEQYGVLKSRQPTLKDKMAELHKIITGDQSKRIQFYNHIERARTSHLHLAHVLLIAHERLHASNTSRWFGGDRPHKGPGRWSI